MADTVHAQAARRLRYDGPARWSREGDFYKALGNLLDAIADGDEDNIYALAGMTASAYLALSDYIKNFNEGSIA